MLYVLRDGKQRPIGEIKHAIDPDLPASTLRDDLNLLRKFKLVRSGGTGRGAWWAIVGSPEA
jgi:hypothetical protein